MNYFAKYLTRPTTRTYIFAILALLTLVVLGEFLMGRVFTSATGNLYFWYGPTNSAEASQQISDWYTLSHLIHGFAFYLLFWWIGKKHNWPLGLRLFFAVLAECIWELWENTPIAINRYRTATISLGYNGDSIINSLSDIVAMMIGFFAAYKLPVWASITLVIILELVALYAIRDNLALNILMFLTPVEAVKNWQASGM